MAISGEMPRLPLTSSERVVRVTPRARGRLRDGEAERLDALAKNNAAGMRRILHRHGETSLVVIQIIDFKRMAFNKSKDHSPVGSYRCRPKALQLSLEHVEIETGKIHILHGTGCIQASEDIAQLGRMFRHNATRVVILIKAFQPLVAERLNHKQV